MNSKGTDVIREGRKGQRDGKLSIDATEQSVQRSLYQWHALISLASSDLLLIQNQWMY